VQLLWRDLNESYSDLFKPIYSYTRKPAIRFEASVSICGHLVTGLTMLRASLDDLDSAARISKAYPHVRDRYFTIPKQDWGAFRLRVRPPLCAPMSTGDESGLLPFLSLSESLFPRLHIER
jgi:hypothetical protein